MSFSFFLFLILCFLIHYLRKKYSKYISTNKNNNLKESPPIRKNEFLTISTIPNNNPTISVLSYNILCQKFMKRRDRKDLNLDNRMKIILAEIKSLDADVICLQETNWNTYKNYLLNNLPDYRFEYGDNYGSPFINLVGYKYKKFKKISTLNLDLSKINVDGNRGVFKIILQNLEGKSIRNFVIYNVHFPWKPVYELEKCYILDLISQDLFSNHQNFEDNFIIAGDFNSVPNSILVRLLHIRHFIDELYHYSKQENNSNFYSQLINDIEIHKDEHLRLNCYPTENNDEFLYKVVKEILRLKDHKHKFKNIFHNFVQLSHAYDFKSAYGEYKLYNKSSFFGKNGGEKKLDYYEYHPDYTNYTENFKNTLDYILFSKNLRLVKILKLPDKHELCKEHFLPSSLFPSDHIKLFSEFYYN
jgi:mRNA deadenylase 3'-5' endonuclease subunit Ccr4